MGSIVGEHDDYAGPTNLATWEVALNAFHSNKFTSDSQRLQGFIQDSFSPPRWTTSSCALCRRRECPGLERHLLWLESQTLGILHTKFREWLSGLTMTSVEFSELLLSHTSLDLFTAALPGYVEFWAHGGNYLMVGVPNTPAAICRLCGAAHRIGMPPRICRTDHAQIVQEYTSSLLEGLYAQST